jgi:AAA15 family ATPase/GTPase
MIIKAFTIENFKGINKPVTINIKPITLLFGPNSAGKSSIIQAIHYAREIVQNGNFNPDKTLSGGSSVDLGGFKSFINDHEADYKECDTAQSNFTVCGALFPSCAS